MTKIHIHRLEQYNKKTKFYSQFIFYIYFTLLLVNTSCTSTHNDIVTAPAIGWINNPTAIYHFSNGPWLPENLVRNLNGEIASEGGTDETTAVFTIELFNRFPKKIGLYQNNYSEYFNHASVIEFTFPAADYNGTIDWVAHLNLNCVYSMGYSDANDFVSFEYIILQDEYGALNLNNIPSQGYNWFNLLSPGVEDTQIYKFQDDTFGTLNASDERRGQIPLVQGVQAKLFIGVLASLKNSTNNNRMELGIPNPRNTVGWCFFEVKGSSPTGSVVWYGPEYTMGPNE